jgi:hypothetical protein
MVISQSNIGFTGVPPSRLGFVCKPDMPPHINILFRARPPLDQVPRERRAKSTHYEGLTSSENNILERFEKTQPPKYIPIEDKRTKRLKSIVESVEKTKLENSQKECKYLNYKYLSVRRYPYFL